jgi:hypothetical protein
MLCYDIYSLEGYRFLVLPFLLAFGSRYSIDQTSNNLLVNSIRLALFFLLIPTPLSSPRLTRDTIHLAVSKNSFQLLSLFS